MPLERKSVAALVRQVRGRSVLLDEDLARIYNVSVKQLNQQVKRNLERFDETFAFQLTKEEWADLRSQSVTAAKRRTPPWAFTEHGVPMTATVLRTGRATAALKLIIDVFVAARPQMLSGAASVRGDDDAAERRRSIRRKIADYTERVLDAEINRRDETTVRMEIDALTAGVLEHVKAQLETKALRNEEVQAETRRKLADAERLLAEARKAHAEADSLTLKNMRERLKLLIDLEAAVDEDVQPMLTTMAALGRGDGSAV